MKMMNAELEFVTFDTQDVIATSVPLDLPLAYVLGQTLIDGEREYNTNQGSLSAVDAMD